jgi:hypothetical protein
MRKRKSEKAIREEMLPEYDFSGKKGVRGKYYRAYRRGHTVRIQKANGTASIKYFTLADGAVMLEPDVKKHFPDSRSVNKALRALMPGRVSREKASHKTGG